MALSLRRADLAVLEAAVAGDEPLGEMLGAEVLAGWAGFPEALPALRDAAPAAVAPPDRPHWGTHLMVVGPPDTVVGLCGFYGPPNPEGTVEIGYAVAPARRGQGLATEAARLLLDEAAAAGVEAVDAHTLAEPNASTAVLEHLGFRRIATQPDPEHGDVWHWRRYVGRAST